MSTKCRICGYNITRMEHHMMAHVDHPDGWYFSRPYVAKLREEIRQLKEKLDALKAESNK